MDRDQIIQRLTALRKELGVEGVEHLAIFGSRARGDHRDESDLDLLVEVKEDEPFSFSLLDLIGVEHMISDAIGLKANAVMRRSLEPRLSETIRNDVIDVF